MSEYMDASYGKAPKDGITFFNDYLPQKTGDVDPKQIKKGTTTVGLICSDGLVLAADKRATMGYFIAGKQVDKIHQLDDRIAMTIAGGVGDAQTLVRIMKAELALYKMRNDSPLTVHGAMTLLSNILYQYKFYPFYVQLILGGFDSKPSIYNLDALGGVTSENVISTGSGSPMSYGLLEDAYKENKPIKENLKLAARAIAVAMKRDVATGEGIDLIHITKTEFKRYSADEVKKIIEAGKAERAEKD